MERLRIKGNWNIIKGSLKQQYGGFTDDDLVYDEGREDELLGRIQKRTGESRQEILDSINRYSGIEMGINCFILSACYTKSTRSIASEV